MARRRQRRTTLLLLRGDGRAAASLQLPRIPRALVVGCAVFLSVATAWLGWELQAIYGLRGAQAYQIASHDDGAARRWSLFEKLAPIPREQTVAQLRRRAALMHAMKLGLGTRQVASQLLGGHVAPEWRQAAEAGEPGDGTLLWPVRDGWFVRGYGSGEDGYHLAVDIMGERGSDVLAAAPGIVGYSGHALRGYGNLVMLVHPGGWVTMYAHNERNHVVAGQRVKRGQLIADLGNTGISRGPHVHFEFIHAGENCDPLALFRPGVRHRPGHLSAIEPLTWQPDEAPPRGVRCAPRRKHPRSRWDDHGEHASAKGGRSRDGDGGDGAHGALASAR